MWRWGAPCDVGDDNPCPADHDGKWHRSIEALLSVDVSMLETVAGAAGSSARTISSRNSWVSSFKRAFSELDILKFVIQCGDSKISHRDSRHWPSLAGTQASSVT
jgi:exonuclease III